MEHFNDIATTDYDFTMMYPKILSALLLLQVLIFSSWAADSAQRVATAPEGANSQQSALHSSSSSNQQPEVASPQEAYDHAIRLLRTVIEPSAFREAKASAQAAQTSPAPGTARAEQASARAASSTSVKARSAFAKLSPYYHFLTAWGPLGAVTRLSLRLRYATADALRKAGAWVPMTAGGIPGVGMGRSRYSRSPELRHRPATWPGEQAAQLWPEWEADGGKSALHGPFLLPGWKQRQDETDSSALTRFVVKKFSDLVAASKMKQKAGASPRDSAKVSSENFAEAQSLLEYASDPPYPHRPSPDALWVLSQHHILGTHGKEPRPWLAAPTLTKLVEEVHPGNSSARSLLGWIDSSREMWKAWGADLPEEEWIGQSQSMALLHHTLAAREGEYASQMAIAYRSLAGVGTPIECGEALRWYERAASQSYMRFQQGPVGGLAPPYTHLRLSDLAGGAYGPGASAASTGWAAHRPAIQAALHSLPSGNSPTSPGPSDQSRLNDLLEFYSYHAQGGSLEFSLRLARIYYQGSIYGSSESAGRVPRDFAKARELALRVARSVWPADVGQLRIQNGNRVIPRGSRPGVMAKENEKDTIIEVESHVQQFAGRAAALLARMYLRGEGVPIDYHKAWMWYWRGAEMGDRDCQYGWGLMRSRGMAPDQWVRKSDGQVTRQGENIDMKSATEMWDQAVKGSLAGHAEASVALGKLSLKRGDQAGAAAHFAAAVRAGSPFEGYYLLGLVNAKIYRQSLSPLAPASANEQRCRAAMTFFKVAAERGDWESPVFHRGQRAWEMGDKKRALLYWSMAAERGDETAQNNVAWILDRDKRRWKMPRMDGHVDNSTDRLALIHWTRSAAQDNVDALVKLGDYYYHGIGLDAEEEDVIASTLADTDPNFSRANNTSLPTSQVATSEPEYEKALACYAAAADRQVSALAYWNMGYLYEAGKGVPRRDFHLAKRYYDMAYEINREAYLPVMLSLIRLHLKALWATVWKGEESAVALFSSYSGPMGGVVGGVSGHGAVGGFTEAEEEMLRTQQQERQREEFYDDQGGDYNLPETYDLRRGRQEPAQQQQQQQQQPRVGEENEHHRGSNVGGGLMSLSEEDADAMIEGAMMVIGLSALAMLLYARQAAQARAVQEQREEERRRNEQREHLTAAAGNEGGANEALRRQEEEWVRRDQQPGGPRYAGGMPWPPDAAGPINGIGI